MTLLVIFYINDANEIDQKSISHLDWDNEAPDNILKIWIKKPDGIWTDFKGWGAYYFKDNNGIPIYGGMNAINSITNFSTKIPTAVEDVFPKAIAPSYIKYGIEVSDEVWRTVDGRRPE